MDDLFERRRHAMVDDLASRGITDPRVLEAMAAVPRERFVPPDLHDQAYADRPLPIGRRQTISQPFIVALTLQAMDPDPNGRALDVGTGSGYAAAVLSNLAGEVWSVERLPELAASASRVLLSLDRDVTVVTGDGTHGYTEAAPFDAIGVAAAGADVPGELVAQLTDGGRLVIPVDVGGGQQELRRIVRRGSQTETIDLGAVRFVPLIADRTGQA